MGKRKQLVKELEAALAQMEQDWRIEHENAGLMERNMLRNIAEQVSERKHYAMVVDAMTAGMKRLTEERDELRLELAGMTSDAALDAAMADIETLTQANEEADATIGALRDDLADMRERLDAALTEAARMRKEWTGDVTAAREIVERKTAEIVELRRDVAELQADIAATQRELDVALGHWQHTEDLLQACERELDTLQAQHAAVSEALDLAREYSAKTIGDLRYDVAKLQACQAPVICSRCGRDILAKDDTAITEPVVTLQAIQELEEGERLIEHDRMVIEAVKDGYIVWEWTCEHIFKTGPDEVYRWYLSLPQP